MLLGFKKRFGPLVREGSKTHTIRAERKNPPKVGEVCNCYCGLRGKGPADLLGRWRCVKVEDIHIWHDRGDTHLRPGTPQGAGWKLSDVIVDREPAEWPWCFRIEIAGEELHSTERSELAWRDGFRTGGHHESFAEMVQFWVSEHRTNKIDFRGQIIHWDFNQPVDAPAKPKRKKAKKESVSNGKSVHGRV